MEELENVKNASSGSVKDIEYTISRIQNLLDQYDMHREPYNLYSQPNWRNWKSASENLEMVDLPGLKNDIENLLRMPPDKNYYSNIKFLRLVNDVIQTPSYKFINTSLILLDDLQDRISEKKLLTPLYRLK